ncbi:MAG: carbonic anhydrase [Acidobacteriota bacterium]
MSGLEHLLRGNRSWSESLRSRDAEHFSRWAERQAPEVFWIGCCDSRVPVPQMVDADASQLFVLRNIANLADPADPAVASALEYAVDVLGVGNVVVCGHESCGGVQAALSGDAPESVGRWISTLRWRLAVDGRWLEDLDPSERLGVACRLNVVEQIHTLAHSETIRNAWRRGLSLELHGWLYDLKTGLITVLVPPISATTDLDASRRAARAALLEPE